MRASEKSRRLTALAMMTAIIVVLQLVTSAVARFGFFAPTLALAPILIGAALYGPGAGAYLGGVFGAVVTVTCIVGLDMGGNTLWNANPFLTAAVCLVKGIAAGAAAGAIYHAIAGKGASHSRMVAGSLAAGVISPVVNTGLFILALVLWFRDILLEWAAGADLLYYIIFGLTGVNFLLELAINLVLSTVIVRVVSARRHSA